MSVYKSAYAALQVCVRGEIPFYHPVTGVETSRVRRLTADFGLYGSEFNMENPLTGEIETHATVTGHYYDTEAAAEKEGWTDDERESVEYTLDKLCFEQPYLIAKVDMSVPPAPAPWPTYNQTQATNVVKLATSLGLVTETLLYERENENRPKIVAELEDWLADNIRQEVDEQIAVPEVITLT